MIEELAIRGDHPDNDFRLIKDRWEFSVQPDWSLHRTSRSGHPLQSVVRGDGHRNSRAEQRDQALLSDYARMMDARFSAKCVLRRGRSCRGRLCWLGPAD